jgi:hypothetical protein
MGALSDDQGNFEVHRFGLPGAYTISAMAPPSRKPPEPEADSDVALGWTRTWYPGVTRADAAARVILPPGGEVSHIEIRLQTAKAHWVRGVVLGLDGKPAAKAQVVLDGTARIGLRVEANADGKFEIPGVVEGSWRLSAEVAQGGTKLRAGHWMEMSGHDVEGVKLPLSAPFTIRAYLTMELPQGVTAPRGGLIVLERADHLHGLLTRGQTVVGRRGADDGLILEDVYPDTYSVTAVPPPGFYMESLRLGDAELNSALVELAPGAPAITVTYKTNGGTVRGTVEHCADGGVTLVAQNVEERWRSQARPGRCDAQGKYEINGVRPGEYYAVATPADSLSSFWDSRWDEGFAGQATKVTVRAGEVTSVDLRAVGRE